MTSDMKERAWTNIGLFLYQFDLEIKKISEKTFTASLEDFKKETIHVIQQNMFR